MSDTDKQWHLDKKVPLALIFAIATQTAAAMWWASGVTERMNNVEKFVANSTATAPASADRLTRVEVKVDTALDGIQEIKRLIQRQPP